MNIEQVREFALGINPQVTEELFAENWISWRIFGKWFLLMQLDAPEPRVAVKLLPEMSAELRARYDGIRCCNFGSPARGLPPNLVLSRKGTIISHFRANCEPFSI